MVVRLATGRDFRLSESFRQRLGRLCGVNIPQDAFAATDYHLDWLYAALYFTTGADPKAIHARLLDADGAPSSAYISGSQEDADLLIGWTDDGVLHAIVCEAKAYSGWSNAQMTHKLERLDAIFNRFDVQRRLVLVGQKLSEGLDTANWPSWAKPDGKPIFIALDDPSPRYMLTRCDGEGTSQKAEWTHWRARPRPWHA